MNRRALVLLTALVGGLCWIGRWVADASGATGGVLDVLRWAGLVLLAVAVGGLGAGLVSRSAAWLQAIVAVAFPLLVWSVIEVFTDSFDEVAVSGVAGVVVILAAVLMAGRRSHDDTPRRPRSGAHAR